MFRGVSRENLLIRSTSEVRLESIFFLINFWKHKWILKTQKELQKTRPKIQSIVTNNSWYQYFVKNWPKNLSTNRVLLTNRRMHCLNYTLYHFDVYQEFKPLWNFRLKQKFLELFHNNSKARRRDFVSDDFSFFKNCYNNAPTALKTHNLIKCQEKEKPPKPKPERSPDRLKPDFSSPSAAFIACSERLVKINYFFSIKFML